MRNLADEDQDDHHKLGQEAQHPRLENSIVAMTSPIKNATGMRHDQTPSPVKQQRTASPAKQATPSKARPWEKIWEIEYRMEEGRKP